MAIKETKKNNPSTCGGKVSKKQFDKLSKTELIQEMKDRDKWIRQLEKEFESRTIDLERTNIKVMQLLRLKRDFFDKVAFGIRSFLTPIELPLKLISDSKLSSKNRIRISIVLKNIEYLNKLVNNVLDIAKVDGGVLYGSRKVDISELIEHRIKHHKKTLSSNKIKVTKKFNRNVPSLWIDEDKISKVIDNIIINSVNFMGPKNRNINFELSKEKNDVLVSITDTGVGIERKHLHKIFEDFYKVDNDNDLSAGLGLSIAEKIVNVHGGKIWAESSGKDKGTKIAFTLPIEVNISNKNEK